MRAPARLRRRRLRRAARPATWRAALQPLPQLGHRQLPGQPARATTSSRRASMARSPASRTRRATASSPSPRTASSSTTRSVSAFWARPDQVNFIDPLSKTDRSLTVGGFIQDSWSVIDKVTVNLGLRYDAQYFYNTAGNIGLSLPNQWSPRLGLIYDPTQSRQVEGVRQLRPLLREHAARLRRRHPGAASRSCAAATPSGATRASSRSSATSARSRQTWCPTPRTTRACPTRSSWAAAVCRARSIRTSGLVVGRVLGRRRVRGVHRRPGRRSPTPAAGSTTGSRTCRRWRDCPASPATPASVWGAPFPRSSATTTR